MKRKGILCFIKRGDQVLLAKIDYGNDKIVWNGISGFVEDNEKEEDAVIREVEEEIGIKIDDVSLKYRGNYIISEELELDIFVAFRWTGTPKIQEESIKELQWFAVSSLPFEEMFPNNKDWVLDFLI